MAEPQDALAILDRIDETREKLRELLRSHGARDLAARPDSGEWSPVENVRHLLFAEQLHLGKFHPGAREWNRMGLTPHFMASVPAFSAVGTEPTDQIDDVLGAWDAIHEPLRGLCSAPTDEMCRALQGNLAHLVYHLRIIEPLLE